jgi:hypothetical protein
MSHEVGDIHGGEFDWMASYMIFEKINIGNILVLRNTFRGYGLSLQRQGRERESKIQFNFIFSFIFLN